ncbi:MAG: glycerol kinase GlpK [Planctomycetota bacterium]
MSYIVALDQGTTSSRAIVFDREARVVASSQEEFAQQYPEPGWVEHNPEEIWRCQRDVLAEAIAGIDRKEIRALGITNQRETTVVWDRKTGEPIANAIVWQDRRTADICDRLTTDGHRQTFASKTGLVIDAYFSGTKIKWLLDHVSGARDAAHRGDLAFGTIDCWLIWKLTCGARHATDVSNASRTLMWNIHEQAWDDELLELLGVPRSMLPEVVDSIGEAGRIAPGLPAEGVPICGIAGDQQAALAGQLCWEPGLAKNTYGTGCFMLMNTGPDARPSSNKLLTTAAWRRNDRMTYALEGSVFIGGALIQWLRDGLGIIEHASDSGKLAETVPDSAGVVVVPAFVGLGAPHWDPHARGTILGLTRGTTSAHLCRAALEAIACSVTDLARAMEADAAHPFRELRVDGGAAASNTLMQIQADLLQIPVVRPLNVETTALGAAFLAGIGAGIWGSLDELSTCWYEDTRFEPIMSASDAATIIGRWANAVERAKGWAEQA